ncbi:MAG: UDP-N-acetylmuramoyl-tripeptide--D-alanyl-D-alanine ligase [Candidatus Bipolaricaulia bacterium]
MINPKPRNIEGFSIDSRDLKDGDFFVPLRGSRTDGHQFLDEAFKKGASGAFVRSRDFIKEDYFNVVLVKNTEKALIEAAANYRNNFDIPIVGITGSWGKTTTKEVVASILSEAGKVHKTPGNYNTEYGLPLSLLEMEPGADFGVFELGLQYPGDVERLSKVLSPTIGLITGVGKVHSENFPSVKEIAVEKLKLSKGMARGSKIIVGADSRTLVERARKNDNYRFIEFGKKKAGGKYFSTEVSVRGTDGIYFLLNLAGETMEPPRERHKFPLSLESNLLSRANVRNILGASALSLELGISPSCIREGVNIDPLPQRLNPLDFNGGTVIDDTYNANPAATKNALDLVAKIDSRSRKIFVLGDMKELGDKAARYHEELATHVRKAGIDRILAVGELTKALIDKLNSENGGDGYGPGEWFNDRTELISRLDSLTEGSKNLVLVKGSRSMGMEKVVEFLVNN